MRKSSFDWFFLVATHWYLKLANECAMMGHV